LRGTQEVVSPTEAGTVSMEPSPVVGAVGCGDGVVQTQAHRRVHGQFAMAVRLYQAAASVSTPSGCGCASV